MIKHLSNHTIKRTSPSKHPKHIINQHPIFLPCKRIAMFLGVFFCCVKLPYTLQLVIIKHPISHIIKNDKHNFLMSELSKIIKSSNHQPIYHLPTLDTFFFASTASPLAMVKTWISDKMPFDPTKIH